MIFLSESAQSILWLLRTDPDGWVHGNHASIHIETGVGVWTANKVYGLHVEVECDRESASKGHMSGRQIELCYFDRRALYKAFRQSRNAISDAIEDWAIRRGQSR
jgi:hypothetical protein